ncbi:MAG: DNA-binding response regulator [Ignavibacteriae bacterium HGW-Ignavibacteriae-3]|nr:MAG: DNA-binding response regulator [Ignavibacteriae bacterium HGW-Ignavibacteriae-3]
MKTKEKIRVIIIDDEKLGREIIKNYLKKFEDVELIAECSDGFEGIKQINDLKPDLILLDIQMPKLTGFEMLEILENPPIIIFTTAFDQYALKAFEVNATDYLLKPFSEERFTEALNKAIKLVRHIPPGKQELTGLVKAMENRDEYLDRVVIKHGSKILIIPSEEVRYIEAQDDYTMLYSERGNYLKQKTMKYFEQNLNPKEFIRIHRSYFVKLSYVKQIELFEKESYRVVLHDGVKLPVSKSGYQNLKEIIK